LLYLAAIQQASVGKYLKLGPQLAEWLKSILRNREGLGCEITLLASCGEEAVEEQCHTSLTPYPRAAKVENSGTAELCSIEQFYSM